MLALQIALFAVGLALVSMGFAWAGWIIALSLFIRCLERFGWALSLALILGLALLGALGAKICVRVAARRGRPSQFGHGFTDLV